MAQSRSKLEKLADIEGFETTDDLLASAITDSVCPGICINENCSFTCEIEPDQDAGWCEECHGNSVKSALVLARLI